MLENAMAIPASLWTELEGVARPHAAWFSIDDIRQRDPDLTIAARYVRRGTNEGFAVPRDERGLYERLESWAMRLLNREVRLWEERIWEVCVENSSIPSPDDDTRLCAFLKTYIASTVSGLEAELTAFSKWNPKKWTPYSQLDSVSSRLLDELAVTIPLAAEIMRLEMIEHTESGDRIGYAQHRIERFFSKTYGRIPHPFGGADTIILPREETLEGIGLLTYVIFRPVDEPRLIGFEDKFSSVFLRYMSSSRESSGVVVEQVCSLFEPFLKKLCFIFDIKNGAGQPLWRSALDGLLAGLPLTTANLKEADPAYWQSQPARDAVFRIAYQMRHKSAHEAHEYPYYESERHAFTAFAAILMSCILLLKTRPDIAGMIANQATADVLRDLFVRIDELTYGPDGPRLSDKRRTPPTRLEKLVHLSERTQAIWPICSPRLLGLFESEYGSLRNELIEADRQADIESYLESMRDDYSDDR